MLEAVPKIMLICTFDNLCLHSMFRFFSTSLFMVPEIFTFTPLALAFVVVIIIILKALVVVVVVVVVVVELVVILKVLALAVVIRVVSTFFLLFTLTSPSSSPGC